MKRLLEGIVDLKQSIISNNLSDYKYPWELLADLKEFIIKLGNTLDKDKFDEISENIWINKSAIVDKTAKIIGPCIIDEGANIKFNAFIRENVIIGKNCVVGNSTEVKNSVLFDESKIPHFNYVGDSILGYNSHLGAGAIISNVRSDKGIIKTIISNTVYDTKRKKYGAIIGDNVEIGCNAVVSPGSFINYNSTIYPLVMVRGEIPKNKIVKDMNNIIDKKLQKIYIDFDSTIFDTDRFYTDVLRILKENNIDEKTIKLCEEEMLNHTKLFDLDEMITMIETKLKMGSFLFNKIEELYSDKYVYDDVIPVLEKIKKKYELILLTYGNYEYQTRKIEASKLKKYFKEIIITSESKDSLDNIDYENGIFIDNSPKEVEKFFKRNVKKVIRVRRKTDKNFNVETSCNIPQYINFYQIYNKELK